MRRRRTAAQKLLGWSVLAAGVVLIVGIFLVTRALTPSAPAPTTPGVAEISSSPAPQPPASAQASSRVPDQAPQAGPPPAASGAAGAAPAPVETPPAKPAVVDAAAMDQGARKAFLNRLIGQGVFTGVAPFGKPAKVGVTELFQGLSPDLKEQFLAVAYAYVHDGLAATEALEVVDAADGKVIGSFTNESGLEPL